VGGGGPPPPPTVRGGATNPFGLRKTLRAMEIAERNRLPLVQLIESSGADLPTQSQIFIPGAQEIWEAVENYCNSVVRYFSHGRRLSNPSWCRMTVVCLAEYARHSRLGSSSSGVWENPAYDAQRTCCDN
jgi:hypothetical protein